jgi:hypothetical protein
MYISGGAGSPNPASFTSPIMPDDFARRLRKIRPHASSDHDPLSQRIVFRPELPGEGVVDNHDGRRVSDVPLGKEPAAQQGNLQNLEV